MCPDKDLKENIIIGKILSTHGVRGKMKVLPLSHSQERFKNLTSPSITSKDGITVAVTHISTQFLPQNVLLISFKEIDTEEKAKKLVNGFISIPEEEKIELPEDTYFHFQLIGMKVITEEGEEIGTISNILEIPSNDVYVIKKKESKEEILIPAIYDVVKEVNVKEKWMKIKVVEGLF